MRERYVALSFQEFFRAFMDACWPSPTCRSYMHVASVIPCYNLICDLCGEPRSCGVEVSIWDFDTFIKIFPWPRFESGQELIFCFCFFLLFFLLFFFLLLLSFSTCRSYVAFYFWLFSCGQQTQILRCMVRETNSSVVVYHSCLALLHGNKGENESERKTKQMIWFDLKGIVRSDGQRALSSMVSISRPSLVFYSER